MNRSRHGAAVLALLVAAWPASGQVLPDARRHPPLEAGGPAILVGRVVRDADGSPVCGIVVRCQSTMHARGCMTNWTAEWPSLFDRDVTDSEGRFRFTFPDGLRYHNIVAMPSIGSGLGQVRTLQGDGICFDMLAQGQYAEVLIRVPDPCWLRGRVVDTAGHGVSDARVLVWHSGRPLEALNRTSAPDLRVTADEHGDFLVQATSHWAELEAEADGFVADDRLRLDVKPGDSREGLTLTLSEARFIEGTIVDHDGTPLANVGVCASRGNPHDDGVATAVAGVERQTDLSVYARSDATGGFRIGPLPHDEVQFRASGHPALPWFRTLVAGDETLHVLLDPGVELSGVVRGADGAPIAGALVETTAYGGYRVISGPDGRYRFTGVPPSNSATVRVVAEGHVWLVVEDVVVGATGETVLDLHFGPSSR